MSAHMAAPDKMKRPNATAPGLSTAGPDGCPRKLDRNQPHPDKCRVSVGWQTFTTFQLSAYTLVAPAGAK